MSQHSAPIDVNDKANQQEHIRKLARQQEYSIQPPFEFPEGSEERVAMDSLRKLLRKKDPVEADYKAFERTLQVYINNGMKPGGGYRGWGVDASLYRLLGGAIDSCRIRFVTIILNARKFSLKRLEVSPTLS